VVRLDRKLVEPHPEPIAAAPEGAFDLFEALLGPQIPDLARRPQRDVDRKASRKLRPLEVHLQAGLGFRPTRALPTTAMRWRLLRHR
jgi:hypothetical protein